MSQNATTIGLVNPKVVSEIWSPRLLSRLAQTLVARRIGTDHSAEVAKDSDMIHLRLVPIPTAVPYDPTGATPLAYVETVADDIVLNLNQTTTVPQKFSDIALKNADVKYKADVISGALYSIARAIDLFILNTVIASVDAANIAYPSETPFDATTAGTGEVLGVVLQLEQLIKENGAMVLSTTSDMSAGNQLQQAPWLVANPAFIRYLYQEPAFIKVDFTSEDAMWKEGQVRGKIAGFQVLETNNLPTTAGVTTVIAGVKGAVHYAFKKIAENTMPNPNLFEQLWRALFQYGCVVSHPKALALAYVKVA